MLRRHLLIAVLAVIPPGSAVSSQEGLRAIRILPCEPPYAFRQRLEQVHEPGRRDIGLTVVTNEFAFTQGSTEIVCRETPTPWMKTAILDFRDYLATSMHAGGGKVRIETGDVEKGYETTVTDSGVVIRAKDDRQAAQALFHLEDVMNLRRAPFLPLGTTRRVPRFSPRMVHSGLARDAFPHGYLMRLAHAGMDTVLLFIERAGLSACNTHNGTGDEIDCGAFIRRMKDYGFDTYIYLQATGFKHPDDSDAPAFFNELYGGISKTCPGAKGYIVVDEKCHFPSKDPHVCQWDPKTRRRVDASDPRPYPAYYPGCDYHDWLKCVTDSIHRYSPEAEIVFWTYAFVWAPFEPRMEFIRRMPKDMTLMATFEMGLPYVKRNGFRGVVKDYSISEIGPGPFFREQAGEAVRQGLKVYSQANTAGLEWDFGTIPYNPVPYQWCRRWEAVCEARRTFNLQGVMECHHYGVWPGFLTELEKEAFTEGGLPFDEHLRLIAARDYGAENVVPVLDAWRAWSEAVADMPASVDNQYGPFRMGPAFLYNAFQPELTAEDWWQGKTPWHTMRYARVCGKGRSVEALRLEIDLFASMAERYFDGAERFCKVALSHPPESAARERALRQACLGEYMARAVLTAKHIREGELAERADDRARATEIAHLECENVRAAIELLERDSRLGWEPTMGYQAGAEACRWKIARLERLYGKGCIK